MSFTIVSVCVGYLDFLSYAYEKNKEALSGHDYWIITDSKDAETQKFCEKNYINCHVTDIFYRQSQPFNKGAAINSLFLSKKIDMDKVEWIILTDSDIIFNDTIHVSWHLEKDPDCLYNCGRKIFNTKQDYLSGKYTQGMCHFLGYFQLFHKKHAMMYLEDNVGFLYEFRNSSYYDCEFANRFECKRCIGADVDHLGPIYLNWDGRISSKWE